MGPSYGMEMVGLSFNPGNNPAVDIVKKQYAEIIDNLNDMRSDPTVSAIKLEWITEAIGHAMTAQMWTVKAITCPIK